MSDNAPSLTDVVKQVAEQQEAQAIEIEKSRGVLRQLQTQLYGLESELKSVLLETKVADKQICQEEDTIEHTMHLCGILENQNYSSHVENIRLKLALETEKEDFEAIASRNNSYRERIADNIKRFSEVENKLTVMIELIKKRDAVRILTKQKEEMISDTYNPEGTAIKQVQVEVKNVLEKSKELKQLIAEKNKVYEREIEIHATLRKEIEVQKKRYDAIVKRLHCQLNKAQQNKRQYKWNMERMEKSAADLREKLGVK
ncbi:coiled-coil domain-containing protein 122 [Pelodytes ibericus]